MNYWRLLVACACLLLAAVIVMQNTEEVETSILFARITMPRAVLLFVALACGFVAGSLTTIFVTRRRAKARAGAKA